MYYIKNTKISFLIFFLITLSVNAQFMGGLMIPNEIDGTVTTLSCASPTRVGTLVNGVQVSTTVTASIPYTGGVSGGQVGLEVQSTGVTGLTATSSNSILSAPGSILFTITGTPVGSGTATFPITVGGVSCSFTMPVAAGLINTINCTPTNSGTSALVINVPITSTITSTFSYTGGNGGLHIGQNVNSTGVLGLTATLAPGNFEVGAGNLVYTITGTPNTSGNASFAISIGGKTCSLILPVAVSTVSAINCGGATVSGMLKRTVNTSGITITIPYTGGNGGLVSQTVVSSGITGITATLTSTNLAIGNGTVTYTLSGIPSSHGTANFAIAFGTRSCTLSVPVAGTGAVVACGSATKAFNVSTSTSLATLSNGHAFSGTYTIPYTGGDGLTAYGATSQTVNGITFTRVPGTQAVNSGNYVYNLTGNLLDNTMNASFTLEGCTIAWGVVITVNPGSVASNGCNGGATGGSDLRTFGWQNTSITNLTLSAGTFNVNFNANITANGVVYAGNPDKELKGMVAYRLVNTATSVSYAATSGAHSTFSGCSPRGVGNHSASGVYSGSASTGPIPAGTYRIEVYGESYMGNCSSGSSDLWAGCGLSVNSCTITLTRQ